MVPLSIGEIAAVIGADFAGDFQIDAVSTDTRELPQGCLFLALKGESFDGHRFIKQALESGARCAIAMQDGDYPADKVLRVPDTRKALLQIAGLYRRKLGIKVVGITGSVGKTTTKELVACVLESTFHTLKTAANLNNEVGLPKTILQLEESHRAAVLEMGMDAPGQIRPLAQCAAPDVGIITSIGVSHLESMGTRENILAEKLDICAGIADGGTLILCGDNDLLRTVNIPRLNVVFYGVDNGEAAVCAGHLREFSTHTTFEIQYNGKRYDAQIPCMGRHNVCNALAAFCAGIALGVQPPDAIAALKNYRPAGMRQNIVVHNSYTVVEDCYNASPDSMRAALETLGRLPCDGRRIAVLSDMLELGAIAREAHYEAGLLAARNGIDLLLCTGELAAGYAEGAKADGLQAEHFPTQEALFETLKSLLTAGDVVWFKASRGMKLEQVISRIYKECSPS